MQVLGIDIRYDVERSTHIRRVALYYLLYIVFCVLNYWKTFAVAFPDDAN